MVVVVLVVVLVVVVVAVTACVSGDPLPSTNSLCTVYVAFIYDMRRDQKGLNETSRFDFGSLRVQF